LEPLLLANLDQTLQIESPRLTPRRAPITSALIGGGVVLLFIALVAQVFFRDGLGGWAVGLVYIAYDTALLGFTAWHMRAILRRPVPTAPLHRPSLGVIIAAHNEALALPITIDALMRQIDLPDLIVIADDGSSDATEALLSERYGLTPNQTHHIDSQPDLLWLPMPHGGKARALNAAITRVDTDIILTVDADTLIEEHAIGAMRTRFAAEPVLVAATGVLMPVCGAGPQARFFEWFQRYEYIRNFISRFAWMQLNSLLLISGAFAAFRREALVRVGGFDPACLVEDYELIHRLHRHSVDHGLGWTVRVVGEAQARTDAPETLPTFLRQRRRWFAGFLQTQRWNRDMTGNPRFGALGKAMMPVKALDTLQPIYGLTAFAILIVFVAIGRFSVALPILIVMLVKIVIDMSFHLWSLHIYRRWTGATQSISWPKAICAALLEPFSFQLMRHAGAAWGWWTFLTGRQSWGRQNRGGIVAQG
jgi:cellulose synthase/poly-beta-1,6-N-acetylglucosamine synthase-like glycosyltransferase